MQPALVLPDRHQVIHQFLLPPVVLLLVDLFQLESELELREPRYDAVLVQPLPLHLGVDLFEDVLNALIRAPDRKGQNTEKGSKNHGGCLLLRYPYFPLPWCARSGTTPAPPQVVQ